MRTEINTRDTMSLKLPSPPESICILRLSALGDITHVLPTLRTLQHHWPQTRITWIIGKTEYALVRDIPDVEFILFDKAAGLAGYVNLWRELRRRRFDILLHLQPAIRASLAAALIPAHIKLGFDKSRAKDLQWLFSNQRITPASTRQHVLDSFLEFPKHLGLEPVLRWDLPVDVAARDTLVQKLIPTRNRPLLVINPCAVAKSRNWRNWHAGGYAAVADHAVEKHGLQVVLSGGKSELEKNMAEQISALCKHRPLNLVGQTSIQELVALLDQARVVIAPDTGPAHIASALNTPVIGLYAATNPDRAGPYRFPALVVNAYPEALRQYYGLSVEQAPWGLRIRNDQAMQLIRPEAVMQMLDRVLANTFD